MVVSNNFSICIFLHNQIRNTIRNNVEMINKGAFRNYMDKMRGEGSKNVCFCLRSGYKNCPRRRGEGVKKQQNSVHVVVECPLRLSKQEVKITKQIKYFLWVILGVYSVGQFIVERNLTMLNVTHRGHKITLNFKLPPKYFTFCTTFTTATMLSRRWKE